MNQFSLLGWVVIYHGSAVEWESDRQYETLPPPLLQASSSDPCYQLI